MISIIIPINHKDRVGQEKELYRRLKSDSGVPVQVICACDNPEIYESVAYDVLVRIPKRIEFTQSVNLGEKFSIYPHVWYMDDSITPVSNWGKTALEAFYNHFPNGEGLLEISGANNCATRCIARKSYLYKLNGLNMLWPEYLHCGDAELYERTQPIGKFHPFEEVLLIEKKIDDASRIRNKKIFAFDEMIREIRRNNKFHQSFMPDWQEKLRLYCKDDSDLNELYRNLFNL